MFKNFLLLKMFQAQARKLALKKSRKNQGAFDNNF